MKSNFIRNINDEYALVTGGTTGLGFLYVSELINIGYNVIIASPHDGQKNHELEKLAKSANKKIICLKKDLCTLGNCEFVYNECIKYNIILVINNSGIGT
jgi:short-subunit dehydrogenase